MSNTLPSSQSTWVRPVSEGRAVPGRQATVVAILSVILAACGARMEPTPPPPVEPLLPPRSVVAGNGDPSPTAVLPARRPCRPRHPRRVRSAQADQRAVQNGNRSSSATTHPTRSSCARSPASVTPFAGRRPAPRASRSASTASPSVSRTTFRSDYRRLVPTGEHGERDLRDADRRAAAPGHTALPPSMLVLLAKGSASKGKVTWKNGLGD